MKVQTENVFFTCRNALFALFYSYTALRMEAAKEVGHLHAFLSCKLNGYEILITILLCYFQIVLAVSQDSPYGFIDLAKFFLTCINLHNRGLAIVFQLCPRGRVGR